MSRERKIETEKVDIGKAKDFFASLRENLHEKGSPIRFMPFVLIRSCTGDNGTRPLSCSGPFWKSPDIWTAVGVPDVTPEIPPDQVGRVVAEKPNTVYAHVWNLGLAPIAGVKVEWYWFNPSLGIDDAHAHLIGTARVDLAPRGFPGCHKLVKCPEAWVPVMENEGHECLVARISAFGDPLSKSHPWNANADRHVAQFNLTVLDPNEPMLDQVNNPEWKGGSINIVPVNQVGQTFIPTLPKLVAIEIDLRTANTGRGGDQVTMRILDLNNQTLFTGSATIAEGFEGFSRFNISSQGRSVDIGKPLTITVQDTSKNVFHWKYSEGNTYRNGNALFEGKPFESNDFYFKTYGKE